MIAELSSKAICYLAFDITDAQVLRRVTLFKTIGAEVSLVGFRRSDTPSSAGIQTVDLGPTENGALGKRMVAILRAILKYRLYRRELRRADSVLARNLEMLIIALASMPRGSGRPRLIYESLDIHRTMSGRSLKNRLMRWIERRCMTQCDLLITSSPRFLPEHFERDVPLSIPYIVVENKVPWLDGDPPEPDHGFVPGPPWIIGWFGRLRCRKSLLMLRDIAERSGGKVKVLVAGRVSYNEMPDFDQIVEDTAGLEFLGPYTSAEISDLYQRSHFAWCIDFMEEGQNSDWLLPNRIYESSAYGAIPLALDIVETGAWLKRQSAGVLLQDPVPDVLRLATDLNGQSYAGMLAAVEAIPRSALFTTHDEARKLVDAILEPR